MTQVLDASVLIAALNGEEGAEEAIGLVVGGIVSSVNLSEVVAKLQRLGVDDEDIFQMVDTLSCEVVAFDHEQSLTAGLLWRQTKHRGLSLGDRACLALAMARGLPCYTGDRAWIGVLDGADVRLFR